MFFFDLYGNQGCWMTILFSIGLIVMAFGILYSVRHYKKPVEPDGAVDEHAEPGVPLVLKALYLGFFIWLIVVTYLVATMGSKI
jgi:hypothetical protein